MAKSPPSNSLPSELNKITVGLAIDWISSPYHVALWKGISDYAEQHHINLIVFPGREINSPYYYESQANIVYDIISEKYIDGVIITADSIADHINDDQLLAFCHRFSPLPIVSIAKEIENVSSISIENVMGMRELMLHLVDYHQFRSLAFISGPNENFDSQQRLRVYKEVLTEYEIPIDENLIEPGDFRIDGGIEATENLLNRGKQLPDVIIAADDSMAIGALSALKEHGLQVPEDIALVGFDDEPGSQYLIPPLTTVQQPFYDQGYRAAEMLVKRIKNQSVSSLVELPSRLIVRQSCGCHSNTVSQTVVQISSKNGQRHVDDENLVVELKRQQDLIVPQMIRSIQLTDDLVPEQCQVLFDAFLEDYARKKSDLFIRKLNEILLRSVAYVGDVLSWQYAISILRKRVLSLTDNLEIIVFVENIWHQARVLIAEMAQRKQAFRRAQTMQQMHRLREISEGLIATFDMEMMLNGLAEDLPRLGIKDGYVTLYDDVDSNSFEWGRLVSAFVRGRVVNLPSRGIRYPIKELIPDVHFKFERRFHLIVLPLFFKSSQLGFTIFSVVEPDEITYDILRGHLSSAIQGAKLMNQVQHYAKNLEDEVQQQTNDVREANRQLQAYAIDLEEANAKLEQRSQDLRDFAYISSHDLQEPLRKIQLFSTLVETKYQDALGDGGQYYLQRIAGTANQIQTMIHDLFAFAQVTFENQTFSQVNLTDVIEAVSHDLYLLTTEKNGRISWSHLPVIEAVPLLMYQLFHHLLSNGLKFHRHDVSPMIQIESVVYQNGDLGEEENPYCEIHVVDNGIGFEEKYGERIFSVFRRLHDRSKYEGSGVGLAVCRKIVEQHNGRITAKSIKGKGSTFIVRLPLTQAH